MTWLTGRAKWHHYDTQESFNNKLLRFPIICLGWPPIHYCHTITWDSKLGFNVSISFYYNTTISSPTQSTQQEVVEWQWWRWRMAHLLISWIWPSDAVPMTAIHAGYLMKSCNKQSVGSWKYSVKQLTYFVTVLCCNKTSCFLKNKIKR